MDQAIKQTNQNSWSEYYKTIPDLEMFIGNLYGHKEFLSQIVSFKPKRVLEVGSGSALMSIFLSYLGMNVTAVDNDKKLLASQKEIITLYNAKIKLKYADAFNLPFKKNEFDIIFHQGLFEHFSDDKIIELLDEQLRVAPIMVFSVPNKFYPKKDFGNERLLSKNEWDKILKNYNVIFSRNYSKKIFPKIHLPRAETQYMAVIKRK